jgi:hypothetical protein
MPTDDVKQCKLDQLSCKVFNQFCRCCAASVLLLLLLLLCCCSVDEYWHVPHFEKMMYGEECAPTAATNCIHQLLT